MTEMPLTETGRGVSLPFQVIGNGVFLGVQTLGRSRKQHALMHTYTLGVTTGEQRRAGGRAHRRGYHEAGKLAPFFGDAINVRRLDGLGSETAQVAITLIVSKDDDEIGFGRKRGFSGEKENGQQTGQDSIGVFHRK